MRSTSVRTMPTDGSRRPRFALASRLSPTTVCSPVPCADHLVRNRRDPSVRVVDVLDRRFCLGEGVLAQLYRSTVVSGGVRRGGLIERGVHIGSPYFGFAVVDETVERSERAVEARFPLGHVGTQVLFGESEPALRWSRFAFRRLIAHGSRRPAVRARTLSYLARPGFVRSPRDS